MHNDMTKMLRDEIIFATESVKHETTIKHLTLYHTIPNFNKPEKKAFLKCCGKQ